jgi:NADH-quinone oxidoreductase subunit G
MQDGEPHLAGTAKVAAARLAPETAAKLGVTFGDPVTVSTEHGAITLPAAAADLPPDVVWLPENSGPATVRRTLRAGHGAVVAISPVAGAVRAGGGEA